MTSATSYRINTKRFPRLVAIHNSAGCNCPKHLSEDVEHTSECTDLAVDQEAQSDRRVQVCPKL